MMHGKVAKDSLQDIRVYLPFLEENATWRAKLDALNMTGKYFDLVCTQFM